MKRSDIKPGIVYASQRSANYSPDPVVFLTGPDDGTIWSRRGRHGSGPVFCIDPRASKPRSGSSHSVNEAGFPCVRLGWAGSNVWSRLHAEFLTQEIIATAMLAISMDYFTSAENEHCWVVLDPSDLTVHAILDTAAAAEERVSSRLARSLELEWVHVRLDVWVSLPQIKGVYAEVVAEIKAEEERLARKREAASTAMHEAAGRAGEWTQLLGQLGIKARTRVSEGYRVTICLDEDDADYVRRILAQRFTGAGRCLDCDRPVMKSHDGTAVILHRNTCLSLLMLTDRRSEMDKAEATTSDDPDAIVLICKACADSPDGACDKHRK